MVGKDYWTGLVDWVQKVVLEKAGNVSADDLALWIVVDTAEEAVDEIDKFYSEYLLKPNF
jgi:predicted Rossmann-fold nucleotide-binding protein